MRRRNFISAVLLVLAAACTRSSTASTDLGTVTREGDAVRGTGTIQWSPLEGGFYFIAGDDGSGWDPTNLAASFQTRGLRVRFQLRVRNDLVGIHMSGPIVDIVTMEKI